MARRQPFSRKKRTLLSFIVLVLTLVVSIGQQYNLFDTTKQVVEINEPGLYDIDHFVDGDTIAVKMNGKVETIRFIGIDTPETHKPNTPIQCYGPEAATYTKSLISAAGSKVRLQSDPDSTNRDRYNRLLRYIYLPDNTLLNEKLVLNGYAFYYPYFPYTKSAQFHQDELNAMAAKKGLWGHCTPVSSDDGGYKMTESEPTNL